jgi:O-antigen ligase
MISCRPLRRRVITAAGTTGFVLTTVFTLFLSTQLLVRAYHGIVLRAGVQGSRYTAVGEGKVSMSVRFGIWEKIMDVVKQHDATLHGIGTGGSAYVVGTLPHAHGLYLSVFFDLGLIGVILLLIIAATILTQLIHVLWARDSEHRTLMIAYFAGLFALGLNSCIEFDFLLHMFWAYLALGQASYWYFQKQEAASASLKSNQHESRE